MSIYKVSRRHCGHFATNHPENLYSGQLLHLVDHGSESIHQRSLLPRVCPFFKININANLLVEPEIHCLQLLARIGEAEVEEPQSMRNQFINLAQRYLYIM